MKFNKATWVKKYSRPDTQKMKKGWYHNSNKGDSIKMRKNKKKDIQEQLNEASMTTAIRGYLSSMKNSASSGLEEKPWYLSKKELKHSLSEQISLLNKMILEEDEKDRKIAKPNVRAIHRFDVQRPEGKDEEKFKSKALPSGIQPQNALDFDTELSDPKIKDIRPFSKSQESTPDFVRKLIRQVQAGEVPSAKSFEEPKQKGVEFRSRGLGSGQVSLDKKSQEAKESFLRMLDARNAIIDRHGGPRNAQEKGYKQMADMVHSMPEKLFNQFLKTKFTSYDEAYNSEFDDFLINSNKRPLFLKTAERGDALARLLIDDAPPQFFLPYLQQFMEDPEKIIKIELRRLRSASEAGKRGEIGSTVGKLGGRVDLKALEDSEIEFDTTPDSLGQLKSWRSEDEAGTRRAFNQEEVPFEEQPETEFRRNRYDETLANMDSFDDDDKRRLKKDLQHQKDTERLEQIFGKADEATSRRDGHLGGEITELEAEKAGISSDDKTYLASKILFSRNVRDKIIEKLSRQLKVNEQVILDVLKKMVIPRKTKNGESYFTVSTIKSLMERGDLEKGELKIAQALFQKFSPTQIVRRVSSEGGNVITNFMGDALRSREEAELRIAEPEFRKRDAEERRQRQARKKKLKTYSPDERKDLIKRREDVNQKFLSLTKDFTAARGKDYESLVSQRAELEDVLRNKGFGSLDVGRLMQIKDKIKKIDARLKKLDDTNKRMPKPGDPISADKPSKPGKSKEQRKVQKKKAVEDMAKNDLMTNIGSFIRAWKRSGMEPSEIEDKLRKFGLGGHQIQKVLHKYTEELKENRLPMTMENLKNLVRRDFGKQPSLAEMLLSPEGMDKEEEVDTQTKEWDKAKPSKVKNFYSKLSIKEYLRNLN